ncbi:MAG: NmrA family NAD(P)-binding protein [Bdellovibrionales bacterium]|nr:NmrA family NAD(P)-binding protein [Bdellovibrionales bacterium]
MSLRRIAIVGATGMLGQPVARALIKAGFEVRAVVRDPQKAKTLLPPEVSLLKGDLQDPASLEKAFAGCDAVYLNLQVDQNSSEKDWCAEREGADAAIAAAKKTGVKRIAYLSSIVKDDPSKDWWVFRVKRAAVQKIKDSGIPYTIFCPSCFMENLSHLQIQGAKLMNISGSMNKNFWISGDDYGAMVARAFSSEGATNKEYWIQGPESITMDEAAQKFVSHYGKAKLKIQSAPIGVLKVVGLFAGRKMRFMTNVMDSVLKMPEPFRGEDAWRDLGRPVDTVETYAQKCQ